MANLNEEWRTIPGFPDYEVSNLGAVRSWRNRYGVRPDKPKLLKQTPNRKRGGYMNVTLRSPEGESKLRRVHALVLEAFVGPRPEGFDSCHNDGNPANNHLDNLRWADRRTNLSDKISHGTAPVGTRSNFARISTESVNEIKAARGAGERVAVLAARYGVSAAQVYRICTGKSRVHG